MSMVDHLKKITVSFEAGTSPENMDLEIYSPDFQFVFGIAAEGMTPFEYQLVGKSEGDVIPIFLKKKIVGQFFEHLQPPLWDLFNGRDAVYLKAKIIGIAPAENREVLKAMSEMVAHGGGACGCDGDCGCGCG
jgi:hypothetical protein